MSYSLHIIIPNKDIGMRIGHSGYLKRFCFVAENKQVGLEGAMSLAQMLEKNKAITALDLSGVPPYTLCTNRYIVTACHRRGRRAAEYESGEQQEQFCKNPLGSDLSGSAEVEPRLRPRRARLRGADVVHWQLQPPRAWLLAHCCP